MYLGPTYFCPSCWPNIHLISWGLTRTEADWHCLWRGVSCLLSIKSPTLTTLVQRYEKLLDAAFSETKDTKHPRIVVWGHVKWTQTPIQEPARPDHKYSLQNKVVPLSSLYLIQIQDHITRQKGNILIILGGIVYIRWHPFVTCLPHKHWYGLK